MRKANVVVPVIFVLCSLLLIGTVANQIVPQKQEIQSSNVQSNDLETQVRTALDEILIQPDKVICLLPNGNVKALSKTANSILNGTVLYEQGAVLDDDGPVYGACCIHRSSDGMIVSCDESLLSYQCITYGQTHPGFYGEWKGDGTSCSLCSGPACNQNNECIQAFQGSCNEPDCIWKGPQGASCDGVNCDPNKGACCLEFVGCVITTAAECRAASGWYFGNGSSCTGINCETLGRCCYGDGTCGMMTSYACAQLRSSYMWTPGGSCNGYTCPQWTGPLP